MFFHFPLLFFVYFLLDFSVGVSSVSSFTPVKYNFKNYKNFKKFKRWNFFKPKLFVAANNVIYKQELEYKTPFKKYNINDIYYGKIIKIDTKKIKIDILCDRKAYLNTSDFFREPLFKKYIFVILKLYNTIKVKITDIDSLNKKIFVSIQKYKNDEIYSSFQKKNVVLKAVVLDIFEKYVLLYIAPNVHARLIMSRSESTNKYKIGSTALVQLLWLDRKKDELYVKPYIR